MPFRSAPGTMTYTRIHAMPVYKRGHARPRPWPYHATLDKVGLVLGSTKKNGQPGIQTQKPEDQENVAPTDYGENAQNPIFGRTHTWRTFHMGMGLAVEDEDPAHAEGRYRWAINADCSIASRLAMKGPSISMVVPPARDTVNGIPKFFDLKGVLYWLNGRYLNRLDANDTDATMVADFGAGNKAVDVCVFASNGLGGAIYAYIAVVDAATDVDTKLWRFDGTTLVQNTDAAGSLLARNLVAIGRNFYRANNVNQISVVDVDTDPWVWDNWGPENQFIIGDKSSPIVALIENAVGVLTVLKTDGVYSVDPQGEGIRYFPFLKFGRSDENGLTWGVFMNDLYVRYGESLYRVSADFSIAEVGPNRVGTVDGPVKGRTTAFAGHANFHAYTGMWDADSDTAFLMKYGAHQSDEMGQPQRLEAWHGSISAPILNNRITSLFASGYHAPTAHNRMYIGFRDGSIGFFVLPCVPDPAACDEYRFSLLDSWVVFPNWHGGFPSSIKPLRYLAVSGDNLNNQRYATVSYRADPVSADALPPDWLKLIGNFDTLPSERIEFPEGTQCHTAAVRLELHNVAVTGSPLITSVSLRWRLNTDLIQVFDLIILAEDGLITRDGTPLRRGAKSIRDHVRRLARDGSIVELAMPDEEIKMVSIYNYSETIGWWERAEKWVSALQVSLAEDATGSVYGTYGRLRSLTYGDLRGMTYGDLRTL